jgi:hypothetical protein
MKINTIMKYHISIRMEMKNIKTKTPGEQRKIESKVVRSNCVGQIKPL